MRKLPFVVCSARLEILFALKFYCICHIPSIIWGGFLSVRPDSPTGSPQHTQWLIYLYSLAVQSVSVGRVPAVSPRLKPERLLHFILLTFYTTTIHNTTFIIRVRYYFSQAFSLRMEKMGQ